MEQHETSQREISVDVEILFNRVAMMHMLVRMSDTQHFGGWHIIPEDETVPEPSTEFIPEAAPSWIISRHDIQALDNLHKRIMAEISAVDPQDTGRAQTEGHIIYFGGCVICKIIMLIFRLLYTYNYYSDRSIADLQGKASDYLNPEIVPDLKDALMLTEIILFKHRDWHPFRRKAIYAGLYAVMKLFFDVLQGMLPSADAEIARLRETYDEFHTTYGENHTSDKLLDCLMAVSRRFAAEEPKWERRRAALPDTPPTPAGADTGKTKPKRKTGKGSRPRKNIPVEDAAREFGVSKSTIGNWDRGQHSPPPEYPGREVSEEMFNSAGCDYLLRRHNKEQAAKNAAAGLTFKSREPKSQTGTDSTRREHDSGNFQISNTNGGRIPL